MPSVVRVRFGSLWEWHFAKFFCYSQVTLCDAVHSAGSQLPPPVLEMFQIVAAGDDSTPLRSEIKL